MLPCQTVMCFLRSTDPIHAGSHPVRSLPYAAHAQHGRTPRRQRKRPSQTSRARPAPPRSGERGKPLQQPPPRLAATALRRMACRPTPASCCVGDSESGLGAAGRRAPLGCCASGN